MATANETHTHNRCSDAVLHAVMAALDLAAMQGRGPMRAVSLPREADVHGNRENQRRVVRAAIKHLREEPIGARVCAGKDGYWLAHDGAEWAAYLDACRRGAVFEFVRVRRIGEAARDAHSQQGRLF